MGLLTMRDGHIGPVLTVDSYHALMRQWMHERERTDAVTSCDPCRRCKGTGDDPDDAGACVTCLGTGGR